MVEEAPAELPPPFLPEQGGAWGGGERLKGGGPYQAVSDHPDLRRAGQALQLLPAQELGSMDQSILSSLGNSDTVGGGAGGRAWGATTIPTLGWHHSWSWSAESGGMAGGIWEGFPKLNDCMGGCGGAGKLGGSGGEDLVSRRAV